MCIIWKPKIVMKLAICFGDGLPHSLWNGEAPEFWCDTTIYWSALVAEIDGN